ncbi:uncharacterized protein LOC136089032 isoform X4 [Hydra vulgaris]|uniref:uncharacterized protein LOC136089032 isoform X4 n=1 Tax=Hydra vulgaris TaxID=6087 RepID=UPI0032E9DB9F
MNNLVKGIENQFQNEHSELRFAKIEETLGELRNLIMQSRSASVVSLSPVVSVPLPPVVSVPLPPVVSVPLPPVVSVPLPPVVSDILLYNLHILLYKF